MKAIQTIALVFVLGGNALGLATASPHSFNQQHINHTSFLNCQANFSYSNFTGSSVQFTDSSQVTSVPADSIAYLWNFGDGQFSLQVNPTHTYSSGGAFQVCLYITAFDSVGNTLCADTSCTTITVNNPHSCNANFSNVAPAGILRLDLQFNGNVSSVLLDSVHYQWTFGDGDSSSLQNPSHTYAQAGNYQVCLRVTAYDSSNNSLCTDLHCRSFNLSLSAGCQPYFSYSQQAGNTVQFIDSSQITTSPLDSVSYQWYFGDGNSSLQQNPQHTYSSGGTYQACLFITAYDSVGTTLCTDSVCQTLSVGIPANCQADFTGTPRPVLSMNFQDASNISSPLLDSVRYQWNFGDGNSSSQQNPSHTYAQAGNYQVCLTIMALDSLGVVLCTDTRCQSYSVSTPPSCAAQFSSFLHPDQASVDFHDSSQVAGSNVDSIAYQWTFGDGNTSVLDNPSHTYSQSGTYQVCLRITALDSAQNILCTDSICENLVINLPDSCRAEYIVDTANSYFGNVIIWNTSYPRASDPEFTSTYLWDFGDGQTSAQPFPVHNYAQAGVYEVCLSLTSLDSAGRFCTDTFCDSLGADSQGNLIYKNQHTGFSLNVLDPENFSREEHFKHPVSMYPNPAREEVRLSFPGRYTSVHWRITDLNGSQVASGRNEMSDVLVLDVAALPAGIYLLHLDTDRSTLRPLKLQVTD